jgi:muramidase (phage lysozyme)
MTPLLIALPLILGAYVVMNKNSSSALAQVQGGLSANMSAFLATIRHTEGTDRVSDPYGVIEGYATFTDKSCHPFEDFNGRPALFTRGVPPAGSTTASGAYQIVIGTWNQHGGTSGFGDFSDSAQDACAVAIIDSAGATDMIEAGDFAGAYAKLGSQWASFTPDKLADASGTFVSQGGTIA